MHTGSVAALDTDITALGAELIWVLESDPDIDPGTAQSCMEVMDELSDPTEGWCVGDGQTWPDAKTFDNSPFSVNRGFDMVVDRRTMTIEWVSSHGSPAGNDNPTAEDVLQAVRDVVDAL